MCRCESGSEVRRTEDVEEVRWRAQVVSGARVASSGIPTIAYHSVECCDQLDALPRQRVQSKSSAQRTAHGEAVHKVPFGITMPLYR